MTQVCSAFAQQLQLFSRGQFACAVLLHLAASTITQIYKERWQIELFFKALKQNLKVKTFLGTSGARVISAFANAVNTQIWTALIAMPILKYLQMKSTYGWSLFNLAALVRQQLFIYRDLWAWLKPPAARRVCERMAMPLV
jgi:IS4 transposase